MRAFPAEIERARDREQVWQGVMRRCGQHLALRDRAIAENWKAAATRLKNEKCTQESYFATCAGQAQGALGLSRTQAYSLTFPLSNPVLGDVVLGWSCVPEGAAAPYVERTGTQIVTYGVRGLRTDLRRIF